jgi:hypothetical protein
VANTQRSSIITTKRAGRTPLAEKMLKNILTIIFGFKFLVMMSLLLFDLLSPDTYVEVAHDDTVTLLFRSVGFFLAASFGLLTLGLLRSKRWVVYLYSFLLLLLIIVVIYVSHLFISYEAFRLPVITFSALAIISLPVLIEILMLKMHKTMLVK